MTVLHILWTTGEKDVAVKVVFPYVINSKANGWWDEINLIIWGPSARLAATDQEIRNLVKDAADSGITIEACRACTDSYRVTEAILEMGIAVRYMGGPLTDYLNSEAHVMTF